MRPTDDNPRPRPKPLPQPSVTKFPVSRVVKCRRITEPARRSFVSTFEGRRSTTVMRPAPLSEVVNAVAFATRPRQILLGDAVGRSRRPSPSGGAIHPVDTLFVHSQTRVFRYAPMAHELEVLRVSKPDHVAAFMADCREILPAGCGTPIVLAGDLERVHSVYRRPESLLWRDGGALLQTLALSASAYELAFCPLGILGTPVLHAIGRERELTGIGVALIGRRV